MAAILSQDMRRLPKVDEAIFFKTRMCSFYPRGKCSRGSYCSFAHEDRELQQAPDLYKTSPCLAYIRAGICRDGNSCQYAHTKDELRVGASKSKVEWPSLEEPSFGGKDHETKLSFSRQPTEDSFETDGTFTKQVSDMSCWSESIEDFSTQSHTINEVAANQIVCMAPDAALHKTKMCKFFPLGKCLRGKYCKFAHEENDLQPVPDLYRTKPCLALLRTGRCKDGNACKYAHSLEEIRMDAATPYFSSKEVPSLPIPDRWSRVGPILQY
mmetsp:Transcript_134289/g.233387  ORF Transcript_134289/g.233387 Transcript_134289/m.233387 type:complete len:269 (+) Transcript_134289:36-842(+)